MERDVWRKSSRSGSQQGACVEVMHVNDAAVLVRDSKNPEGPRLTYTEQEWDAFLHGAKSGEFDLSA